MQEVKGQITDIIYQNEINGYTICVIENSLGGEITAVGYLPFINAGDTLILHGKYVMHKDYGEQFKIETFEKTLPETLDGLINYLGSGLIKGVGKSTAKKIVDKFGEDTINVFKTQPERLATIRGISETKAFEISAEFIEKWELWQIVQFLEKFGIGASNAKRIYKELGENAIQEIEQNPYVLVDIVYGIDFKKIDKMALNIGIDVTFSKRIESGIKYALLIASNNGNTCVEINSLKEFVKELLNIEDEYIDNAIINCKMNNEIVVEDDTWVYLQYFNKAEQNISDRLFVLQNSSNIKQVKNIEKEIKKVTEIELSEMQQQAVKMVNENNVSIITGGPGTGKTTIIKTIIDIYKNEGKKVVLCAPTGRAAKRMTETTNEEAKTIHRLLELGKFDDNFINVDEYVALIDADIIIIDEMSMVDVFLMNYLLKGIYQGTKLVLVGDVNQLPSVGPGCVLKDLINSDTIPVIELNTIFRQAAKSNIVLNAHNVNNGKHFLKNDPDKDFFYINEGETTKVLHNIITLCTERLQNFGDYDFFENIQVMSATKKGELGTKELNKQLQNALNPSAPHKNEKTYGDQIFREGDKIMQIKNNYDLVWVKGENETGNGIFNGELGRIKSINEKERTMQIIFDDEKEAWYNFSDLDQLELAYAITIHKAQGSEFDVGILVIPATAPILLTRNLLYTGITRAKKMLIVIGQDRVIDFMINNTKIKQRNTGLLRKLEEKIDSKGDLK